MRYLKQMMFLTTYTEISSTKTTNSKSSKYKVTYVQYTCSNEKQNMIYCLVNSIAKVVQTPERFILR